MKTIFNKLYWPIFFLWIIISGTAYTNSKCGDSEYSRCCFANSLSSKIEKVIESCAYTSHCWELVSTTSCKKDFCCKKKECTPDGVLFFNTQSPNFQTDSIHFTYTSQRHLANRALRPVFDQHKTRQSISIYTLIQSLLC